MSRFVPAEELELIERVISEHPEGIGLSALEKSLADYLPGLWRRLKRLQENGGRIITEGESISLAYKRVPIAITVQPAVHKTASAVVAVESYIPVSQEGPLIQCNLSPLSFIDVPEQTYVDGTLGVYEFNQIDLLRDVFTWAYERSCQRYQAISQNVTELNPLRIRYREALTRVVQIIVQGRKTASEGNIAQLADELVPENDREAFAKMVREALRNLHEGSVARYKLKLSEFQVWQKHQERQAR